MYICSRKTEIEKFFQTKSCTPLIRNKIPPKLRKICDYYFIIYIRAKLKISIFFFQIDLKTHHAKETKLKYVFSNIDINYFLKIKKKVGAAPNVGSRNKNVHIFSNAREVYLSHPGLTISALDYSAPRHADGTYRPFPPANGQISPTTRPRTAAARAIDYS